MKRIFLVFAMAVLTLSLNTGCNSTTLKDGEYTAKIDKPSNGYTDFVTIEVSQGVIKDIKYDAKDKDGNLRNEDQLYAENMSEILGITPEIYSTDLISQFNQTGDIGKVDGVTGATRSSSNFRVLMESVINNARKGDTSVDIVRGS